MLTNPRLGCVYRCLGYICVRQGQAEKSFLAYQLALKHFKETVGDKSHYTSQICSNLGAYHVRLGQFETARLDLPIQNRIAIRTTDKLYSIYYDQALRGYRMHDCYTAELARTLFRLSQTQEAEGDEEGARVSQSQARELYVIVVPNHDESKDLLELDFENILPLASR